MFLQLGFSKIPPALIRRYSCELRQPVDTIATCLEFERVTQLEHFGKQAVRVNFKV